MENDNPTFHQKTGILGSITLFYYKDLREASRFYSAIMGFELVIDVGFAQVYRIDNNSHVGLVDSNKGYLKTSQEKPVMLSLFTEDIEVWYKHLKEQQVEIEQPPTKSEYLNMNTMLFKDPEGYTLEILEWLTKPYGKTIP
jgi:predicted enzyme related to lactoylglutathione lyase